MPSSPGNVLACSCEDAMPLGLYRLTFADPGDTIVKISGEPVYLLGAMTADKALRLKPQNLLTGLPVRHLEMAN